MHLSQVPNRFRPTGTPYPQRSPKFPPLLRGELGTKAEGVGALPRECEEKKV